MSRRLADDIKRIVGLDDKSRPLEKRDPLPRVLGGLGVAIIEAESVTVPIVQRFFMVSVDGRPEAGFHDADQWYAYINADTLEIVNEWTVADIGDEMYYTQNAFLYNGSPTGLMAHLDSQLISWYPKIQKRLRNASMTEFVLPYRMSHVKPAGGDIVAIYSGIDDNGVAPSDAYQTVYVFDGSDLSGKKVVDVFSGGNIAVEVCGITDKFAVAGVTQSSNQDQLYLKTFDSVSGDLIASITVPNLDTGLVWSMAMTDDYVSVMYDDSTAGRRVSWYTHDLQFVGTMVISPWQDRPAERHTIKGNRIFCVRRLDPLSQITNNRDGSIDVYDIDQGGASATFAQNIKPLQSKINAKGATRSRDSFIT